MQKIKKRKRNQGTLIKFNSKMDTIRVFLFKIRALFSIFKAGREGLPSPPGCAPLCVAEYVSISLNVRKYLWKGLNKLFWLFQGSEYAWSWDMFDRLLKMTQVLNKPGFWIWHGGICRGYAELRIYLIMALYP